MNRQERLLTGGGRGGGRCRTEGSSARGDGGRDAISLMPNLDGMHIPIFESSHLEDSYVGDLPYPNWVDAGPLHIYSLLISLSYLQALSKGHA